ncbi:MAG: 1-deoxy-D-xylulose-5-phosphate reductoisomerase [Planctomycetota bacterium]
MRKRVVILGSTGSIGRGCLDVLAHLSAEWEVVGLAAGSRWADVSEQAQRFSVSSIAVTNGACPEDLKSAFPKSARLFLGPDAMVQLLDEVPCDCVVAAVVGAKGLSATLRAVELGRRVALANKEALVIAGSLLIPLAKRTGATIIPVDSEHSAVFQALHAGKRSEVRTVYLTASGGPFRTWTDDEMDDIRLEDALRHPTWSMGPKITIDSATMMNKALEIVEARWLFGLAPEQIKVVVHPESIIHSLVEFRDGSMIAQLGTPDMRTPIQYALTYPDRRACPSQALDLFSLRCLTLHPPDVERFPALRLGYEVAARGGTSGAVLNGANEAAVELFQQGTIHYREIAKSVERVLSVHECVESPTLQELLAADQWARHEVTRCLVC